MRICVLPGDPDGPGHYRALFPAMALEQLRRHEARMPPMKFDEQDDFLLMNYTSETIRELDPDLLIVHASMQPGSAAMVEEMRWRGMAVVVDVDDYVLGVPSYVPNWRRIHARQKFLNASMKAADLVTVSTPFLAEAYAQWAPRIEVLPNYLWWPMWEDVIPQYEVERPRLRIGWMGSVGWRERDLRVLQGVIGPWLERHPEVDFVAAGDETTHEILGVPEGQRVSYPHVNFRWSVEKSPWYRHGQGLQSITATFDIGLIPLELSKFNEGKSHLKGMEYGACGIPAVASPSSSYRAYIREGESGLLAAKPKDWVRALDLLVADDDLRRRMGQAAREQAQENSIEHYVDRWESLYSSLVQPRDIAREAIKIGAVQKAKELRGLLQVVTERRPKLIVEIGTAAGGTFHALAQAAPEDAFLISLDLPGADGVRYSDTVDFEKLKALAKPLQRTHFIRANSHLPEARQFLEQLLDGQMIDLLLIDGDHSYEGVKTDFELYSPIVDGVVCFHDIATHKQELVMTKNRCDVDRFWNEIRKRYPHDEFRDPTTGPWGGIGVLYLDRQRLKEAA